MTYKSVPTLEGNTGYTVINGKKNTLIPDKGFQNTVILYQAVIAQSVEPRQIFVSISINERFKTGESSNPTRLIFFFVKEISLNIIIA